jgi:hypothetical protein
MDLLALSTGNKTDLMGFASPLFGLREIPLLDVKIPLQE